MELLFTKRKRAREEAEARARGESVDYLVREAPEEFRFQLWYALERAVANRSGAYELDPGWARRQALVRVAGTLVEEYGRDRLSKHRKPGEDFERDLQLFVLNDATTEQLMDVIGVASRILVSAFGQVDGAARSEQFRGTVARRLREHKLAFDIVEGIVVPKDTEELHQAVVVPTLTLLHGRRRFADAEKQYRDALNELSAGHWADAITDAQATVEATLREVLGLSEGYGTGILNEARRRGLLGDADHQWVQQFTDGLKALTTLRNKRGDAHGHDADRETAWLAVHWAAALVVFFVERAESRGM